MKIEIIDESKFTERNLENHKKHLDDYINTDSRFKDIDPSDTKALLKRYNEIGDWLSNVKNVGKAQSREDRFVGYIDKRGRRCIYDKRHQDFLAFDGDYSITLHKKTMREYASICRRDFASELPENQ